MTGAGMMAAAVLCAGCAQMSQLKQKIAGPEPAEGGAPRNAAQNALNEGVALYDRGEFNGAIKHLSNAPEIWSADKAVQTRALKYMAFSYCVTSRPSLCRQQFEKALKLDPAFDLAPGEKGHPQWGPVFARAKRAK
jgi:tetratricopeptide (TPR) repeat protein